MNTFHPYQEFNSVHNIGDLWERFCFFIDAYKVSSTFYAIGHSARRLREDGLIQSAWFKGNHPRDYQEYFDRQFHLNKDPTAMHCLTSTSPYIWHDSLKLSEHSEEQRDFLKKSEDFGMAIGVTLPIRFNQFGMGGIGLCMEELDEKGFDKHWESNQEKIISLCNSFDEVIRTKFMLEMYPLTPAEIDALDGLVNEKSTLSAADKLGKSESTLEKQIASARVKLKTRGKVDTSFKAVALGIVSFN